MERSRAMHGSRVPFALALLGIRNGSLVKTPFLFREYIVCGTITFSHRHIRYFEGQVLSKNTSLPFFLSEVPLKLKRPLFTLKNCLFKKQYKFAKFQDTKKIISF